MSTFRFPRMMGITSLITEYHRSADNQVLEKAKAYIINQWLMNNGRICNQDIEILPLSQFLECSPEDIRIQMRDNLLSSKIWDKDSQEALANALMGTQIAWALEDRMEVERQLDILKRSQKGSYAPFITSELNKVIGLKISTSSSLQSVLRSISGSGSVNIFNQVNTQVNTQNNLLTKQEAFEMLQEINKPLLEEKKEQLYIEAHHNLRELPEVVATKQQGGASKEKPGLNISELQEITDYYSVNNSEEPVLVERRHDTRRADLEEIDLDS